MSNITPALWATEFEPPMPEGMTYAMFNRLATQKQLQQTIDDTVKLIQKLQKLPRTPELQEWIDRENINLAEAIRRLQP